MRSGLRTAIALSLLLSGWAGLARAAEYEDYERLSGEVLNLMERLETAPESERPELRERAIEHYQALIMWYDEFLGSDAFDALPAEQRRAARIDRHRLQYNRSRELTAARRCDEAQEGLRDLLQVPIEDEALRPLLVAAYDEASECARDAQPVTIIVDAAPADATLSVDGDPLGAAGTAHELPVGSYHIRVDALGYESQSLDVTLDEPGRAYAFGPIRLDSTAEPPERVPDALEWALWGAGAAGVAAGIGYFLAARGREDDIANLSDDLELVDPAREQGVIDTYHTAAYVLGGVGVVAAIVGTIRYVSRDAQPAGGESNVSLGIGRGNGGMGVWIEGDF